MLFQAIQPQASIEIEKSQSSGKERRMKLANATKFNRKSGQAKKSAVLSTDKEIQASKNELSSRVSCLSPRWPRHLHRLRNYVCIFEPGTSVEQHNPLRSLNKP